MSTDAFPARIVVWGLKLYKVLVSPLFAGSCRYLPSCSDYMAEAVHRHGAATGVFLGLKRLARCHPWGGSGLDPVERQGPGIGRLRQTRSRAASSRQGDRGPVLESEILDRTTPGPQAPRRSVDWHPMFGLMGPQRSPDHNRSPVPGPRSPF